MRASRCTLVLALVAGQALLQLAGCQAPGTEALGSTAQVPWEADHTADRQQGTGQPLGRRRRHYGSTYHPDEGELGCDDVTKLDAGDDLCAFVRSHCHAESLVNYPQLYYCHVAPHGTIRTAVMLLGCIALLALLFRIISRASDDFFSCILSQISQDLGLPPRLGGVTLLALGNGAPDLSASIAAVKMGNYQLAMGALTGAGMFVGGVVAGRIVTLSGGVRARGAQIRDISTQFITMAVVAGIVASGWFTYASVATLLSIYAGYVVVVAVADFTKRAGLEWKEVARKVSRRVSGRWRVEMVSPLLQGDHGVGETAIGSGGLLGSALPGHPLPPMQQQREAVLEDVAQEMAAIAGATGAWSPSFLAAAATAPPGTLPPFVPAPSGLPGMQGGRAGFGSMPDIVAAERRQQQELYWYPQQQHHHNRRHPPVVRFEPRVPYSDLVQMPAKEYRQRALAEMAQSRSFFVRDRLDREEGIPEEEEEAVEEWEGSGLSDEDMEEGWVHGPPRHPDRASAEWYHSGHGTTSAGTGSSAGRYHSGGGSSGGTGSGSYQPPMVDFTAGSPGGRSCWTNSSHGTAAAAAVAAVAAVDADAGGTAASDQQQQQQQQPEAADLQQLDRQASSQSRPSAASTPHNSYSPQNSPSLYTSPSIGSFEMMTTAEAAGAAVAEVDAAARAAAAVAPPGGACGAYDVAPWGEGGLGDTPQSWLRRGIEAFQWPVLVLLQATIPLVEANSYQHTWFLRSLATSPLFIAAYLHLFSWQAALVTIGVSAAMVTVGHLGTRELQGKAPIWTFGTGYPIGAALVAVYGFSVAAMWISLFASEIVGLLQFFGMLSKIEPAVLGVTVLAWGNSLMDYLNNTAMAGRSRGGNSMAMTACFAGPLFNMLVGLGLGFLALLEETGAGRTAVEMDPVVLVGCLFVMLNCASLVAISLMHRQHLPAWCGWAMIGLYLLYLIVVLAVIVVM